jgi:hypothetical protein
MVILIRGGMTATMNSQRNFPAQLDSIDFVAREILAVHFRTHKAEGARFRAALARAAEACGLKFLGIPVVGLFPPVGCVQRTRMACFTRPTLQTDRLPGYPRNNWTSKPNEH